MGRTLLTLAIVFVLIAGLGIGYLGGVSNQKTITTTTTLSCPNSSPNILEGGGGNGTTSAFLIAVSFQGQWSAVVTTYSAFQTTSSYLHSTCDYSGNNTAYTYVNPWNTNGEQTVQVSAYKLDSSNGNLTVTVTYGAASRSNSTILPFGSAKTFISTAP
jgi:hypothetical protein